MSESLFNKKETLAKVFSSEFCEIFKNTFFIVASSALQLFSYGEPKNVLKINLPLL